MIYLDYAADTPVSPLVLERFCQAAQHTGNANSHHAAGRHVQAKLDAITTEIARLLSVSASEIIYTSGATEANNLAVKGIASKPTAKRFRILTTPLEHSSIKASLSTLEKQGWQVDVLPLSPDGTIDLSFLCQTLSSEVALVTLPVVDSELGILQPLQAVSDLVRQFPTCRLHLDATQAVGKLPVAFSLADTVSFSPHKFYGLTGCGILYKRRGLDLEPQMSGGSSTSPYRSGTPALALAASVEIALTLALADMPNKTATVSALNAKLRSALKHYPHVQINSPESALPHILNLSVEGVKGTRLQKALDAHGICVSVKSACSSDGLPSESVLALTHDRRRAFSSIRISLSHLTTEEDIVGFLSAFTACYQELCPS